MPFSNIKSLEIKEKMKYYDKLFNQKKSSIILVFIKYLFYFKKN